jgi:Uma2 family endonuclease
MSPIGDPHAGTVDWLAQKLVVRLGESVIVRVQGPVQIAQHDVPQPDIVVLRVKADFYKSGKPKPEDVLLLIEVADSTVRSDRYVKVPKYGAAGIPETWLVDLQHGVVLVHTEPQADGYGSVHTLKPGDVARPLAFPEVELAIAELLG